MYRFRREGKTLQWHGPSIFQINNWDHSGTRLEYFTNVNWRFILSGSSNFGVYGNCGHERLRPVDYDTLTTNQDYAHYQRGFWLELQLLQAARALHAKSTGDRPPTTTPQSAPRSWPRPTTFSSRRQSAPVKGLTIDNTYLLTRLRDVNTNAQHVQRSHPALQVELSIHA